MLLLCLFFFKQKTAYEMRISDWSSDVFSSDLAPSPTARQEPRQRSPQSRQGPVRSVSISSYASHSSPSEYLAILLNELFGVAIQPVHHLLPDVDVQVDLDRLVGRFDLHAARKGPHQGRRAYHHCNMPDVNGQPPCSYLDHLHRTGSLSGG